MLAGRIYLVAIFAIIAYVFDLPIQGLLATSAVVAIILGLALQSILGDVLSGIVLNCTIAKSKIVNVSSSSRIHGVTVTVQLDPKMPPATATEILEHAILKLPVNWRDTRPQRWRASTWPLLRVNSRGVVGTKPPRNRTMAPKDCSSW